MDPPRRSSAGGGAGAPPHYSPSSSTYPHIQELQQSPQQQQPSMFYADPSNPFVDQPLQYPLHQVHQHQQQPLYPYVAQGGEQMQDAIPAQARDTAATTGSPVSRQSSGIPASRGVSVGGGGSSYPIISTAALDMDSSEHTAAAAAMDLKQQFFLQQQRQRSSAGSPSMMFPDIVLNKDTARGGGVGVVGAPPVVLTAPPVAVTAPKATPSKPGFFQRLFGLRPAPPTPAPGSRPPTRPVSRAGSLNPLGAAAAVMSQRVVWNPRTPPNPFKRRFSPLALLLFVGFLAAAGYYLNIRFTRTLDMGSHTWYGVLVLVVELIGLTSVIPYGLMLPFYTTSSGSRGLPIDDGRVVLPADKRFRVHILVPCYKESLEVITNTVTAALAAEVPPGVTRILYLCDDGKDAAKREFIKSLGDEARYVSGRVRQPGEINGKSANVNNCLRNVVFAEYEGRPEAIPMRELVVVFDADMAARRNFLLKVLEAMWDDSCSLVLTPQAFSNINPKADIFNNINQQFWEYVLPGCDALGYIACTGTNFCLRAWSLAQVGWFPEYTITEDYALSMELKSAGFKGRYLAEYLAVGEAPDEIRNVCRQRSRWTKGHMQIFFSRRCPLLNWNLPLIHKLLYTNGTWAYFTTIITTLVFLFVPFNSLVFGYHPVTFSYEFALAATIYLPLNWLLMNYVRSPQHMKGHWMAQVSNHILCFTYIKAVGNTLLSIVGFKATAGFKATDKSGGNTAIAAIKNLGANLVNAINSGTGTANASNLPVSSAPSPLAAAAAGPKPVAPPKVIIGPNGQRIVQRPMTQAEVMQAQLKAQAKNKQPERRGCWLWVNAKTLEGALDPLFLAFSLCVSLSAIAAGIYTIIKSNAFNFSVNNWDEFTQVFTSGRLDVYILVPMLWAMYNAIPPLLFFVYFFTKGRVLQGLCSFMQVLGVVLAAVAVSVLWLMVPNEYNLKQVLPVVTAFSDTARSGVLPPSTAATFPWLEATSGGSDPVYGGYYMSPEYVKYSFPIATSMTLLAWSLVEFSGGYAAAATTSSSSTGGSSSSSALNSATSQLRWGADYLMRAHTTPSSFVVQVGDPRDYLPIDVNARTGSWGRPSDMPANRKAITLTPSSKGGADAVAAAAAALAATYQVFKTSDPAYAVSALQHAQELYALASLMPTNSTYCAEAWCAGAGWARYTSSSIYDDLSLAASWLYVGTGVRSYAVDAEFYFRQHQLIEAPKTHNPLYFAPSHDNQAWSAAMMLAQLLDFAPAKQQLVDFFRGWMRGSDSANNPVLLVTPRGLHYLGNTPVPTAAEASMLALIYAHSTRGAKGGLSDHVISNMECFALQQVTYALGGQMGKCLSFVTGLGDAPPRRPAHPQASCPADRSSTCDVSALASPEPNPNVISGAVVAGPDSADRYADDRSSEQSRVSPMFNIPYAAAIAGLLQHNVKQTQCQREAGLYQATFLSYTP